MKMQEARHLMNMSDYKSALQGVKDFRIGVSAEQRSVMRRAYECLVHPEFYRQLGKNIEECIQAGIAVLMEVVQ
jgi:hypothetical protein